MSPSTHNMLAATLLLVSASVVAASPLSGKMDSDMPFLTASATAVAAVAATKTAEAQQWWTPSASQSEWDWKAWSETRSQSAQAQSTAVVVATVATTSAATIVSSKPEAYSNPFTVYTSMTDSRGVITGMPDVATGQPTQAAVATVCSGCASVKSAEESWSSMVDSIYSISTRAAAVADSTLSTSTLASATESASASRSGFAQATGAASRTDVLSSGAMLAVFGAVAALL